MRYALLLPRVVFAGALAMGCDDQPSLTGAADPATPSLRATVNRTTEPFGFAFSDGQQIVFLGLGVEDLTGAVCTGADFSLDEVNGFHLLRPDGSLKDHFKGDVTVIVVDLVPFNESFCNDPSTVPMYIGTARLVLNDNDFFVTGKRADASMMHVRGTVTDESGQRYHLVATNQQVLAPGHPFPDVVVQHADVKIHLTPVGH